MNAMDACEVDLPIGSAVRITGGKYNGFEGTIAKLCEAHGSVVIKFEGKPFEVVVETKFMTPLEVWLAGKNSTELRLRGHDEGASP